MPRQRCEVCGSKIRVMAFEMTGVCSGNCEEARNRGDAPTKKAKRKGKK